MTVNHYAGIGAVVCINPKGACLTYCGTCHITGPNFKTQCPATAGHPDARCELPIDHDGQHMRENGAYIWPVAPPALSWEQFTPQEKVNHPTHYGGDVVYEHQKVVRAWGLNYHLGNCTKYICRAGKKDTGTLLEDLKKAKWYLDAEISFHEEAIAKAKSSADRNKEIATRLVQAFNEPGQQGYK